MKKKDFLVEVMAEIDNIKTNATQEEIGNLNIDDFIHSTYSDCIYGQMTGHCSSRRATELTPKTYAYIGEGYDTYKPFKNQNFTKMMSNRSIGYTALEKYLYMVKKPMHKKIIAYLKNETDTLNLI